MIYENISLKDYNTFKCSYKVKYFSQIDSLSNLIEISSNKKFQNLPKLIIGNGSNLLFIKDFEGLILKNKLKGIEILNETNEKVYIKAYSGEDWNDFVLFTANKSYYGLENLAYIPGTVGAAPIQNIGAYGIEIKDYLVQVTYLDLSTMKQITINKNQCLFSYRDSIFKHKEKLNNFYIISVVFELNKMPCFKLNYKDVKLELEKLNLKENELKSNDLIEIIGKIRNGKFPNLNEMGNAGSFFKNPIVSIEKLNSLSKIYENVPFYKLDQSNGDELVKLPAGWLIEKAGWKNFTNGSCGTYSKHALILVNYNNANGTQILELANEIKSSVNKLFNILLEEEVEIIST